MTRPILLIGALLCLCVSAFADPSCAVPMSAPQFGCRNGSATASVAEIPNATYAWTADGATIAGTANTSRVTLLLGSSDAKLSCVITAPSCTATAHAQIDVREPLAVRGFDVPQSVDANQPVTITWSYDNDIHPASQILAGNALAAPVVLEAAQRSYTFTPRGDGEKTLELLASYAASVRAPETPSPKRRSSSRSAATASECPNVRVTAKTLVRGCGVREPEINVAETAESGSTFTASVSLQAGETAHWTVANGTANRLTGPSIEIVAPDEGEVRLGVRVERGTSCFAEASTIVAVTAKPEVCTQQPSVSVERVSDACDRVTVRATFTGIPPFTGRWTDGAQFISMTNTLDHEFKDFGEHTVRSFNDALHCPGTVTNAVWFEKHLPGVTLRTGAESCSTAAGTVTATFTGVPPFHGCFGRENYACEPFTTTGFEKSFSVSDPYWYRITSFRDSRCPQHSVDSNLVYTDVSRGAPSWAFEHDFVCTTNPGIQANVIVKFTNGKAPYVVEWSDGKTSQSQYDTIYRPFWVNDGDETITVVRAWAGECLIDQPPATATIVRRSIDIGDYDTGLCPGQSGTATVRGVVPPGTKLTWSIRGEGSEILSGQGTPTVTYRGTTNSGYGQSYVLRLEAEFPESSCYPNPRSDEEWVTYIDQPSASFFQISPQVIPAGGVATFSFSKRNVDHLNFYLPANRADSIDPAKVQCDSQRCQGDIRDLLGTAVPAGQRSFYVNIGYTGPCSNYEQFIGGWLYID
jgi:hypothetical protein